MFRAVQGWSSWVKFTVSKINPYHYFKPAALTTKVHLNLINNIYTKYMTAWYVHCLAVFWEAWRLSKEIKLTKKKQNGNVAKLKSKRLWQRNKQKKEVNRPIADFPCHKAILGKQSRLLSGTRGFGSLWSMVGTEVTIQRAAGFYFTSSSTKYLTNTHIELGY